jgi:putative endonuclease
MHINILQIPGHPNGCPGSKKPAYLNYFDMAINREKELKRWNRAKKEMLINAMNPTWKELVNERGFIRDTSPRYQ